MSEQQTETLVVARGRSVVVGSKIYRAGETVTLSRADAEHVKASGFAHDANAEQSSIAQERQVDQNPAGIGLVAATQW